MTTLTVGAGKTYATIAAAVAAASSGDTINVHAGTYTNDFVTIRTNLTIQAVNGPVIMNATVSPPNGKAIITEGAPGITVTLSGLTLTGAKVADNNGAGVRYEGGTLVMNDMTVTGNQEGLLGNADAAGSITISNSTFSNNGAGDGYSHNIYVGAIKNFTLTGSTISNAIIGHDVKSRAANNTITNNLITDTAGSASYEIDLPNGGNAVISGNTIQKGTNADNPIAISYGEEGNLYASGSLSITNNVIVNNYTARPTTAVRNTTAVNATISGNTFYGWNTLASGTASLANNTLATVAPALVKPGTATTPVVTVPVVTTPVVTVPVVTTPVVTVPVVTTPVVTTPVVTTPVVATPVVTAPTGKIVLNVSEDAWGGHAQFTVSVDGKQYGGTYTAAASHAAGAVQAVTVTGEFGSGQHAVVVNFLNDAYAGTVATDRNLYIESIADGDTITKGAALLSNGPQTFITGTPATVTVGSGSKLITLQMSEDAWQGDAQFTVKVDGQQVGGALTTTARHASNQVQNFDIRGAFTDGSHKVEIAFVNDAYGGTTATDRNLYVKSVGGVTVNDTFLRNESHTFTAVVRS